MRRTVTNLPTEKADILNLGQWPINEISNAGEQIAKWPVIVFSSSWQHGAATFGALPFDPNRITAIIPAPSDSVRMMSKGMENGGPRISWVGDPTDGTGHFMLSIFEGMKKQIGADWDDVSLTVIPTKEDKLLTSRCAKVKDVMMAEPTPDNIRITIGNSHVFAHPSYSLESQPMNCIQAASAGNIIVAPKHSGFVEACGDYGLLVPHSFVASVYGMAFAAVLLEAVKVSRDAESFSSLVTVQKHQVDFKYGKERAAMAWNELEGMLDLKA